MKKTDETIGFICIIDKLKMELPDTPEGAHLKMKVPCGKVVFKKM